MWKLQAKHLPINLTHQIGPLTDFTQTINSQSRRRRKESSKGDEKRPANPKKARPRRRRSMMTTKRRFLCSSVSVWNAESCSNHSFVTWTVQGGKGKNKKKKDCENVKCKFLVVFKPTKPKPNQNANCCKVITKSRSRPVSFSAVAFSRSLKSFTRGTSAEVISHGSFFFGCRILISLRASFTTPFHVSNGCNST